MQKGGTPPHYRHRFKGCRVGVHVLYLVLPSTSEVWKKLQTDSVRPWKRSLAALQVSCHPVGGGGALYSAPPLFPVAAAFVHLIGQENHEWGVWMLFMALQSHQLNKQVPRVLYTCHVC